MSIKLSIRRFPVYRQTEGKDCGPTCIKIIAKYYRKQVDIPLLRNWSDTNRLGATVSGLCTAAEKVGFRSYAIKTDFSIFETENILPCIAHWRDNHFVVVYKITKKRVFIVDPATGKISYSKDEFIANWTNTKINQVDRTAEGVLVLLYPTTELLNDSLENEINSTEKTNERKMSSFLPYLMHYKGLMFQLILGLLAGIIISAIIPFLTQSMVDVGIQNQNIGFVYLIFISQLLIYIGQTAMDIVRGWIFLHLNTRINLSLLSEFLMKLMKLPVAYFDVKLTGDILQRISDHKRIEKLLTNDSLSVLFSFLNLIVFSVILSIYDTSLLLVFFTGSLIYLIWVTVFLKKRKKIDDLQFKVNSENNSQILELINGMQEIKLHNAERIKRWDWEKVQVRIFKVRIKSLILNQLQGVGSGFINQVKNLLISVMTALLVIEGQMTLGMMLATSYIIGQLNGPILQLIGFVNTYQDAQISLERINEIYQIEDEDEDALNTAYISTKTIEEDIHVRNLTFSYPGEETPVLKKLNFDIPLKKVTAIVGASGSGKTTLMKVLLKYYEAQDGAVSIGKRNLKEIPHEWWRSSVGAVMQDGYIFAGTILSNICIDVSKVDFTKVAQALEIAELKSFTDQLPYGLNTLIGAEGRNLSGGQKQRILIARAVYKNPDILFFDEATSSLDANTELGIVSRLNSFLKQKTALIIAHRLSTVRNAHQIILLKVFRWIQ